MSKNLQRFKSRSMLFLLGAFLLCKLSLGALRDHGPSEPTLGWPVWYRDTTNLPLGLCKSTAKSANGPLCFPIESSPVPPSFPGNVGPEIFYFNLNINVPLALIDLRYIAALEAAYGTLNPPGEAIQGNEVVFSRIRFVMTVAPANGACAGTYRIIHPYGDETFPDVPEGKRALVVTFDRPLGAVRDFEGALQGDVGPFLRRAAGLITLPSGESFVGDPNIQEQFEGSPFGTDYLEVQAPVGCNIAPNSNPPNIFRVTTGLLLGQVWTKPIPTPTSAVTAVYSRSGNTNAVDVEAKSDVGNTLVLAGPPGFPSTVMFEDKAAGAGQGRYHAHVVYDGAIPASVQVVNVASNPVVSAEIGLVDILQISKAEYDPATSTLCVHARSFDTSVPSPILSLLQPVPTVFPTPTCTPFPDSSYQCVCASVPNTATDTTSISIPITVVSSKGGEAVSSVVFLPTKPDNPVPTPATPAAVPDAFDVPAGGPSNLDCGGNDQLDAAAGAPTYFVVKQAPVDVGSVAVGGAAGTFVFTPATGAQVGVASFLYFIRQGTAYSNIASVTLNLQNTVLPPTTTPDIFIVRASSTKVFSVLANDLPTGNSQIDATSVRVNSAGTRGTVSVNPTTGAITYTAPAAAGTDSFTYTVASTPAAAAGPSGSTRVDLSTPGAAENLILVRTRATSTRWVIIGQETVLGWAGTVGTLTLPTTFSCYMSVGSAWAYLGSAPFTATAPQEATITATVGQQITAPDGTIVAVPSCGPRAGSRCSIQCATTNVVSPYPSTAAGGSDRPGATLAVR